jgi:tRNA(Arg) A34 adenosine deaminase TadA
MNLSEFTAKNVADGDKNRFMNEFNDPRTTKKMAYFEADGVCYTATDAKGSFRPLFKLCGAGIKSFSATTNYPADSASELGALLLHNATWKQHTASHASTHKVASKVFKRVEIGVADRLRELYPVPDNVSPIISDIQSESASVKKDGKYQSCGTRTVHRLYMATAFTILRKLHGAGSRDGVVALIVERNGRIIGWGRKNPLVPCWHGETSAIMGLGGKIPDGCCVYSTLKPCNMCAGTIHDASSGTAKVFWGQDDPGKAAASTKLEETKMGSLLDGNKSHAGARALLLDDAKSKGKTPMATQLGQSFGGQRKYASTIDYIVTEPAAAIIKEAETVLRAKQEKYGKGPSEFNENTAFVVRYLTAFLGKLGLPPENLGV